MKSKIKIYRRFYVIMVLGILLCSMCLAGADITVQAQEYEHAFVITANSLQSGKDTYDVQLTIENLGADWEGTARLFVHELYTDEGDAYDTTLSLPQGSIKQFVVKIPKDSVTSDDAIAKVILLDKKAKTVAEKEYSQLFRGEADFLSMGILSDAYSSLTYLDMGGEKMDYFRVNGTYGDYPIKLMELNQDNLTEVLDTLTFLVIDSYNTSILTDEALSSIEAWVNGGGILLVGTGSYAEDILSGLDFLGIQCDEIHAPGESVLSYDVSVDVSQLSMAVLTDAPISGDDDTAAFIISEGYDEDIYTTLCLIGGRGNGAVGILPYSLAELGRLGASAYPDIYDQEDFVYELLNNVSSYSSARYSSSSSYGRDVKYSLRTMLRFFGSGADRLTYGGLKFIVTVYVIFVGPILYLILRFTKKRELYWAAVPVTVLVGILLIYWAGRGFEVVSTRVYSVTMENLSGSDRARTYLHCYDANHREWDVCLSEEYEYAGPLAQSRYRYNSDGEYYHHVKKEGDRLYFGINPTSGFEDSYFLADKAKESKNASISSNLTETSQWGLAGTVANNTDWDFKYFAVVINDSLYVFKDLAAGETCDVADKAILYNSSSDVVSRYLYNYLGSDYRRKGEKNVDILTALGIGLCNAYPEQNSNAVVVVGVTDNWTKAVDDNASEVSYGCLYSVQ